MYKQLICVCHYHSLPYQLNNRTMLKVTRLTIYLAWGVDKDQACYSEQNCSFFLKTKVM